MNEIVMSYPIPGGRLVMWRYLNPHNAEWMWGVEKQIEGEERIIRWETEFNAAALRFDIALELAKEETDNG